MNIPQHQFLRAELTTLERLLDGLPETSILERSSLEFRKSQVEEELASLPDYPDDSLHEEVRTIDGCFLGVLPIQRLFEFREDGTEKVFSGRIDCSLEDISKINEVLGVPSTIRVLARSVGTASPRFLLLSYRT